MQQTDIKFPCKQGKTVSPARRQYQQDIITIVKEMKHTEHLRRLYLLAKHLYIKYD